MLTSDLAKSSTLSVVSRKALGSVLREQWLQHQGFSSSNDMPDLGRINNVQYVLRGSFHHLQDTLVIDLQAVDVETNVVRGSFRVEGLESDVPRLEHDLVIQILAMIDASAAGSLEASRGQLDDAQTRAPQNRPEGFPDIQLEHRKGFDLHSVPQIHIQLSLEKVKQQRIQAYHVAKTFWQRGWSSELGMPRYEPWPLWWDETVSTSILRLPVALFFNQKYLQALVAKMSLDGDSPIVTVGPRGLQVTPSHNRGLGRLLINQIRRPHRVFVRALNKYGEVMAVFSEWSWQTNTIIRNPSPDQIVFSMWPKPFVRGLAEFPVEWIERGRDQIAFDVAIRPNLDERREIVIEEVTELDNNPEPIVKEYQDEHDNLRRLQNWVQKQWKPSIGEALPADGYLPGNQRTAVALLHLHAGKITNVQFLTIPDDLLFVRSLADLKRDLIDYCVACQPPYSSVHQPVDQTFRLQLTLVKDLKALQFGPQPD